MALMEPRSSVCEYSTFSPCHVPLPSSPVSSPLSSPLSLPSPPISSSPPKEQEQPSHQIRQPLAEISGFEAFQALQEAEVPLEFSPLNDLDDLYFQPPRSGRYSVPGMARARPDRTRAFRECRFWIELPMELRASPGR
jgi:hypothetical protein